MGTGSRVGDLIELELAARMESPAPPAYGRLLDVLNGDPALSIRSDEAEKAWRVLAPAISAWERDLVPLEEYPASSPGPPPRHPLRPRPGTPGQPAVPGNDAPGRRLTTAGQRYGKRPPGGNSGGPQKPG
ncbi:hypothetical protein [Streptomyces sp. NPDC002619]|uniref:hypothetical protein n=1 Tax=Streptomyces sp. NPDC002619 TaxID=3364655 RepID=UPI003691E461